jgi:hypothetical protein
MPKFNPKENTGGGSQAENVPAGRYGIALVWFTRRQPKSGGHEYLSVKYEITDGPMKGKSFFSMLGLDMSKSGARVRWSLMCEVCEVQEEFELGSTAEGTASEGDENIARLFKNKPFRAEVSLEKSNGYTNNTVARIVKAQNWTAEEKRLMAEWETEQAEARNDFGMPPDEDADQNARDFLEGDSDIDNRSDSFDGEEWPI